MASYDLLLFMLKLKPRPENKLHAILIFRRGSFAVHIGDHLRRCTLLLEIEICGRSVTLQYCHGCLATKAIKVISGCTYFRQGKNTSFS